MKKTLEIESKNDWMNYPKEDGIYLMKDEDGKESLRMVYGMKAEPTYPGRVRENGWDSEPLCHPIFDKCKWFGPIIE